MNPKRRKAKERRRARKLAEQAWAAASDDQNLDLAEKLIRRAVATQEDNPVLWNDQGTLLLMRQKEAEAEETFRAAISLAPDFAEPYARLAAIRLRQGLVDEAIALQSQAVKYAAHERHYDEPLRAYQAIAGGRVEARRPRSVERAEPAEAAPAGPSAPVAPPTPELEMPTNRLAAVDWTELEFRLRRRRRVPTATRETRRFRNHRRRAARPRRAVS